MNHSILILSLSLSIVIGTSLQALTFIIFRVWHGVGAKGLEVDFEDGSFVVSITRFYFLE